MVKAIHRREEQETAKEHAKETGANGDKDKDNDNEANLSKSLAGTAFILSQQFLTRILTFGSNLYITNLLPIQVMGLLNDFDLFHASALFLSRETIRMALLRNSGEYGNDARKEIQFLVNMSFIPILIFTLASPLIILFNPFPSEHALAFFLYFTACAIELLAEPLYIYCQSNLLYQIRVNVEGAAFLVQCSANLLGCYLYSSSSSSGIPIRTGVLIYAYAQVLYSLCILVGFVYRISAHLLKKHQSRLIDVFWIRKVPVKENASGIYFDSYQTSIAMSFVLQTIVKHSLTVGDKTVLVALGINYEQKGAYRLVSELGSLVARIVFLPIEETSRAYFSKSLTNTKGPSFIKNAEESFSILQILLQFHILLGAYFVFFATNYTQLLLRIMYPSKTDAYTLLAVYCCYVPCMGLNGITEAFLQGVGDSKTLGRQVVFMIAFWFIFISSSYLFMIVLDFGSAGLVSSNMLNMVLRIWFSFSFIQSFFGQVIVKEKKEGLYFKVASTIPGSPLLWLLFFVSFLTTRYTSQHAPIYIHFLIGIFLFLLSLAVLYRDERHGLLRKMRGFSKKA